MSFTDSLPIRRQQFLGFPYLSGMNKERFYKQVVFQHIAFWVLYFLFNVLRWGLYFDDFMYSFESNMVEFTIHIVIVYFNFGVLIPKLFPQKLTLYISSLLGAITVVTIARIVLTYHLVTTEVWKEANIAGLDLFDPNYFVAVFVGELYVVGFTMAIKLGIDYASTLSKTKDLENKKLAAELSFLRSQVQPHFFFNTLNNLYALTLTKSDKAPETILKLSELMSYVIYEGKQSRTPLRNEIKHIQDYLDLEQLRYGKRLEVAVAITGKIDSYYIPPLILIPFIENCFKHGNTDTNRIPIKVEFTIKSNRLSYIVENKINPNQSTSDSERGGIGVKNAVRRLDLLFKNEYSLNIKETSDTFTVHLNMPLYDKMPYS